MRIVKMSVSPAQARLMLAKNTMNRPLRRRYVESLRQTMLRGEFGLTHQGIALAPDGRMLDGQHRCSAIAGLPDDMRIDMMVAFDVDPDTFEYIDRGVGRTIADALRTDPRLTSVARQLAVMCIPGVGKSPTPAMVRPFIDAIAPWHDELDKVSSHNAKIWTSGATRIAAISTMMRSKNADYVTSVYRALAAADFDAMPPVAKVAFRMAIAGRLTVADPLDLIGRCLVVFDKRKAQVSRISAPTNEEVTKLVRAQFAFCAPVAAARALAA